MDPLIGVFHTLLFVLLLSGTDKILRPDRASEALRAARLVPGPAARRVGRSRFLARCLGAIEVVTAVGVAFGPSSGPRAIAGVLWVGVVFAGFVWFVTRLASIDATAGCGCFGPSSAPPGPAHRRANLAAVAVAVTTAIVAIVTDAGPHLSAVTDRGPTVWLPYVATVWGAALLFLLAPSLLADLAAARRGGPDPAHRVRTFAVDREWQP